MESTAAGVPTTCSSHFKTKDTILQVIMCSLNCDSQNIYVGVVFLLKYIINLNFETRTFHSIYLFYTLKIV